ncbi:MAG: hypothetical protein AB7E72_13170 [Lysobacterales bacterium]
MGKRIALFCLMVTLGSAALAQGRTQVLADSGFRPVPDGFGFANWGGKQYPHAKLTADDASFLFGDQVCARKQGDTCIPTPAAQLWIDQVNKSTENGHCEGMAALSSAFFLKQENVDNYGAKQPYALKPDDEWLMRTISTYYATQMLEPVSTTVTTTQRWSLQQIVDEIIKTLKARNDYPRIGIWGDSGGHAVTPYRVEQGTPGVYRVFLYDNNFPGAERYLDIDVPKNRWVYSGGALNPSQDPKPWQGSAGSMALTQLSVRYQPLKCPFCPKTPQSGPKATPKPQPKPTAKPQPQPAPKPQAKPTAKPQANPNSKPPAKPTAKPQAKPKPKPQAKPKTVAQPKPKAPATRPSSAPKRPPAAPTDTWTVYTPSRCTQVQAVSRGNQKQLSMGATGANNGIDGASMRPIFGSQGCVVQLPRNQEYDVKLIDDGRPSDNPKSEVTVFTDEKVYQVSDVEVGGGAVETVRFSGDDFVYEAGARQKPSIRVADSRGQYEVSDFEIQKGRSFKAEEDDSGRIAFSDDDPDLDTYNIDVEIVGDEETLEYELEDVSAGDDGQVLMDIDDEGELDFDVDSDGDGEGNYYDEDDDNDGSLDEIDADDDNDGVADDEDQNYVGEPDDDYSDDGADEGDEGDDESAYDDEDDDSADDGDAKSAYDDEDDSADEGDDEAAYDDDDCADEGDDEAAYDDEDDCADDGDDEAAYDDEDDCADVGVGEAAYDDEDDSADEGDDEAAYDDEDDSADEGDDDSAYDDEDDSADEGDDEAAYDDEDDSADEGDDEAAYDDEDDSADEGEDEAAYDDEDDSADEGDYGSDESEDYGSDESEDYGSDEAEDYGSDEDEGDYDE